MGAEEAGSVLDSGVALRTPFAILRLPGSASVEAATWRLIAKASGRKPQAFDKALDKQIAAMPRDALRRAQEAADRFIDGARVGDAVAAPGR